MCVHGVREEVCVQVSVLRKRSVRCGIVASMQVDKNIIWADDLRCYYTYEGTSRYIKKHKSLRSIFSEMLNFSLVFYSVTADPHGE